MWRCTGSQGGSVKPQQGSPHADLRPVSVISIPGKDLVQGHQDTHHSLILGEEVEFLGSLMCMFFFLFVFFDWGRKVPGGKPLGKRINSTSNSSQNGIKNSPEIRWRCEFKQIRHESGKQQKLILYCAVADCLFLLWFFFFFSFTSGVRNNVFHLLVKHNQPEDWFTNFQSRQTLE